MFTSVVGGVGKIGDGDSIKEFVYKAAVAAVRGIATNIRHPSEFITTDPHAKLFHKNIFRPMLNSSCNHFEYGAT